MLCIVQAGLGLCCLQTPKTDFLLSRPKLSPHSGFPQALEIMENLENHQKSSMHAKIMEFGKT